jgi:hypothetical protein
MGRKPAAASDAAPAAKPVVRRTRRRTTIDHAAQTQILAGALLKARGTAGVSQSDVLQVVTWARGVHEEGAALKALATRVRKANAVGVAERQVAHEVNKALLDSVLSGATTINVDGAGNIVFGDPSATPAPAAESAE